MKKSTLLITGLCASLLPFTGESALLNLQQTPLFLGNSVPPNVFIQLDDSGSMDWEFVMAPYWESCAYDPNTTGSFSSATSCGSFVKNDGQMRGYGNGGFRYFSYVYQNSDDLYSDSCNDPNFNSIQACPSAGTQEWRTFASALNGVYYNPDHTYNAWNGPCLTAGTLCTDASFSSAKSNPIQGSAGYSVTRNLAGGTYEVWIDNKGFSGTRPLRGSALNVTNGANGIVDLWDSHVTIVLNASNAQVYSTTYSPTSSGMNGTKTLQATLSGSACYNVLGPSTLVQSIFSGSLGYTSTGGDGCLTLAQAQTNFANWYQYHRRRSLAAKGAIAAIINQYPNFRYGLNTINNNIFTQFPPASATDFTSYNATLLNTLFQYAWQALGTPLRQALQRVGQYYSNQLSGKTNPIIQSCQQNFTILITDGYWNDDNVSSSIGDADQDGISVTLADVARYYYINDLSPTLANNVVPNAWDPATWQHMVTYTVGFGIVGNLVDTDGDGWPNPPLKTNSNWGNPFTDEAAKADDLWHAAFNSAGFFLDGSDTQAVRDGLAGVLSNIAQRATSAAPVAQNSTVLNISSEIFQSTFNSSNWVGDVLAFPISTTGVISATPSWSASCVLTGGACTFPTGSFAGIAPTNRVIITRNWSGADSGIAFRWPSNYTTYKVSGSLPTNMANFLTNAPYSANTNNNSQITANQAYGQALVDYLRGTRTQELQFGGSYAFRNRTSILGDIVDSAPVYVPAPYRNYPDSMESAAYSTFKSSNSSRTPMVYVGANDGMIHGFNANTGAELIAYIPGITQIYKTLSKLSISPYPHYFFADATPVEGDVFFNGAWHTILVGAMGNGGQGIGAIDITNPSNFSEANASSLYLFEFGDNDDNDLGYIEGSPIIAKVRTGVNQSKWAVIVNNGYNNTQADGNASTVGKAGLYILFIEAGVNGAWVADSSYIEIQVGTGSTTTPNGLSTPFAVDVNGDFIVDYVYAGDLQGNMWKFDLTSNTPTAWKTAATKLYAASYTTPGDQPITAPPVVGPHPNGISNGLMVYFGTGKYLEPTDNTGTGQVTQAFYGIWDQMAGATVPESKLVQQQILGTATTGVAPNNATYRIVSSNSVNWASGSTQNLGWFMNLIVNGASSNLGERQISQPLLRNHNVVFSTILPSSDPCAFAGSGWLMEIDSATGGAPNATPFDTNNDGIFSTADYLPIPGSPTGATTAVAAVQSAVGTISTPTVFLTADKSKEVKVLSGSQGLGTVTESPATGPSGRQNWRQLF